MNSRVKNIFASTLLISFIASAAFADALPTRQIRLSINALSSTYTGTRLSYKYRGTGNYGPLFRVLHFDDLNDRHLYSSAVNTKSEYDLAYNANIMVSSHKYIAWTLVQALFDTSVELDAIDDDVFDIPEFYELSVFKMALATIVWDEMPTTPSDDYCNDKKYSEVATRTNSCPSKF